MGGLWGKYGKRLCTWSRIGFFEHWMDPGNFYCVWEGGSGESVRFWACGLESLDLSTILEESILTYHPIIPLGRQFQSQRHIASEWQGWDSNSSLTMPNPSVFPWCNTNCLRQGPSWTCGGVSLVSGISSLTWAARWDLSLCTERTGLLTMPLQIALNNFFCAGLMSQHCTSGKPLTL